MRSKLWVAAAALTLPIFGVHAQILIGQTAGFTGPVAASVKELSDGAKLYIDAVNARGGVHGQKIDLIQLDDRFDPKVAAENARSLIVERKVQALFLARATPHNEAIKPLLAEHRIAMIAPSTGAMVMHEPVNPYIFNVRATYQREAERSIRHLSLIGIERIAVLHVDDSFGEDSLTGAQKGFEAVGKKPVVLDKFDRSKPDFSAVVPKIVKAETQAVLVVGSAVAVSDALKALRAAGSRAQVVTLSNNASGGFVKQLGEHARGVIVSQVFPYERSMAAPIVKEVVDLLRAKGESTEISPSVMEGFAAAKVLVEGLRRAGPNPSRTQIINALNNLRNFDIGGMELSYSPTDHTGLDYVDLSIIDQDGKFRR